LTPIPVLRQSLLAAGLILLWTAMVRLPFAGNIGEDEVFFALVAQRWLAGMMPYVSSFDVKPPGLFAVFAAAQALFGTSVAVIKGLEAACVALSAFGLFLIGGRHFSNRVGWFAGTIYPLYTLSMSGVNAPTELVRGPFAVFAVLAVLEAIQCSGRSQRWWLLAAGGLLGAAGMVKQTTAFPAFALFSILCWQVQAERPLAMLAFVAGLTLAPAGFLAVYLAAGQVSALWTGAVAGAAGRLSGDDISFASGVLRFLPGAKPLLALLIAALLMTTRVQIWVGSCLAPAVIAIFAWLIGEAAGIVATRSMYDHYFLALAPPLALLAGVFLFHIAKLYWVALCGAVIAAVWPLALSWQSLQGGIDTWAAAAVAQSLAVVGVPASAPVLVGNRSVLVYLLARRPPAARYFHPQHLLCDFPAPDPDPLAVALAGHPAAVVIADRQRGMVCERADRMAELQAALQRDYCLADHAVGSFDSYDVYVDRRQPWARCR
jgi:4-amino-4-deoxy-L-arabinose transferase-like glycosyltransferase